MKQLRFLAVFAVLLLVSASLFAQGMITGQLTGTVTSDNAPLPGATVTITSPNLQGVRTTVTDANGNYNFAALPPGPYTVKVELAGLQTVTRSVNVTLSGTARVDADLRVSAVAEAITVTASAPAVLETTEVQSNFQKKQIDNLPTGRTVTAVATLAPGVTSASVGNGAITISGAPSNDNLILVNGANVQENLRGQARNLFIEDAVQETTVMSGAISAEFGHFTGGVVNAITKSGGNEFSGSLRDTLTNPKWTAVSKAGEPAPASKLGNTYEGTLGGYLMKDRLWFFTAGRYSSVTSPARYPTLAASTQSIYSASTNKRYEGKLTGQITPKHSIVVDYLNNPLSSTNDVQLGAWETSGIDPNIEQQEDFRSAHYSGIFTNNLLGEINWSKRQFTFIGYGGDNPDIYAGTPLIAWAGGSSLHGVANAPYFCGICGNEGRNNKLLTGKLTYFLGTKGFGTHNIVAGAEDFQELRRANNYQSPTNLTIWLYGTPPTRDASGTPIYTVTPGVDDVEYYPVVYPSLGSDLKTDSLYVNDKWDLGRRWSFNIGGRYDRTNAKDSYGNKTSNDRSFSPRLGATFDVTGTGRLRVGATYGRYVGRLAEGVQGQGSPAGEPWFYAYYYDGPAFSGTSSQVVHQIIDWFQARGGVKSTPDLLSIGGFNTRIDGTLKAPGMDEWTIGAGSQLTTNTYVRADYIDRKWNNFYGSFTNLQTGQVTEPTTGQPADLTLVRNTDLFNRTYRAVQLQAQTRVFSRLNLGGNYTYSKLRGNYEGETSGSGPVSVGGWLLQYPEYQGFAQNNPSGYLSNDQRHKLRAWASMDFPIGIGTINTSVLERYDSGSPYSLAATIPARVEPNAPAGVSNYVSVPASVTYYFGGRGAERWDNLSATDLAVNFRFPLSRAELFIDTRAYNVFNQQAQISGITTVYTANSSIGACLNASGQPMRCAAFNPFTDSPVLGTNYAVATPAVNQARKAAGLSQLPLYGAPVDKTSFQTPRTYQVSLGVRF